MTKRHKKAKADNPESKETKVDRSQKGPWVLGLSLAVIAAVGVIAIDRDSVAADMVVYKDPNCGCCGKWIEHMEKAGFDVEVRNQRDVNPIKTAQGVPRNMRSCHTAVVEGYFIEGHVPAQDVRNLLVRKPSIKGLAVPGMPVGSPGMEVPGREPVKYTVYAIGSDGRRTAFAEH